MIDVAVRASRSWLSFRLRPFWGSALQRLRKPLPGRPRAPHGRAARNRSRDLGDAAVNYDLMYQAMVRETKGSFNQIVYWSRLPDWKNQTLTRTPTRSI